METTASNGGHHVRSMIANIERRIHSLAHDEPVLPCSCSSSPSLQETSSSSSTHLCAEGNMTNHSSGHAMNPLRDTNDTHNTPSVQADQTLIHAFHQDHHGLSPPSSPQSHQPHHETDTFGDVATIIRRFEHRQMLRRSPSPRRPRSPLEVPAIAPTVTAFEAAISLAQLHPSTEIHHSTIEPDTTMRSSFAYGSNDTSTTLQNQSDRDNTDHTTGITGDSKGNIYHSQISSPRLCELSTNSSSTTEKSEDLRVVHIEHNHSVEGDSACLLATEKFTRQQLDKSQMLTEDFCRTLTSDVWYELRDANDSSNDYPTGVVHHSTISNSNSSAGALCTIAHSARNHLNYESKQSVTELPTSIQVSQQSMPSSSTDSCQRVSELNSSQSRSNYASLSTPEAQSVQESPTSNRQQRNTVFWQVSHIIENDVCTSSQRTDDGMPRDSLSQIYSLPVNFTLYGAALDFELPKKPPSPSGQPANFLPHMSAKYGPLGVPDASSPRLSDPVQPQGFTLVPAPPARPVSAKPIVTTPAATTPTVVGVPPIVGIVATDIASRCSTIGISDPKSSLHQPVSFEAHSSPVNSNQFPTHHSTDTLRKDSSIPQTSPSDTEISYDSGLPNNAGSSSRLSTLGINKTIESFPDEFADLDAIAETDLLYESDSLAEGTTTVDEENNDIYDVMRRLSDSPCGTTSCFLDTHETVSQTENVYDKSTLATGMADVNVDTSTCCLSDSGGQSQARMTPSDPDDMSSCFVESVPTTENDISSLGINVLQSAASDTSLADNSISNFDEQSSCQVKGPLPICDDKEVSTDPNNTFHEEASSSSSSGLTEEAIISTELSGHEEIRNVCESPMPRLGEEMKPEQTPGAGSEIFNTSSLLIEVTAKPDRAVSCRGDRPTAVHNRSRDKTSFIEGQTLESNRILRRQSWSSVKTVAKSMGVSVALNSIPNVRNADVEFDSEFINTTRVTEHDVLPSDYAPLDTSSVEGSTSCEGSSDPLKDHAVTALSTSSKKIGDITTHDIVPLRSDKSRGTAGLRHSSMARAAPSHTRESSVESSRSLESKRYSFGSPRNLSSEVRRTSVDVNTKNGGKERLRPGTSRRSNTGSLRARERLVFPVPQTDSKSVARGNVAGSPGKSQFSSDRLLSNRNKSRLSIGNSSRNSQTSSSSISSQASGLTASTTSGNVQVHGSGRLLHQGIEENRKSGRLSGYGAPGTKSPQSSSHEVKSSVRGSCTPNRLSGQGTSGVSAVPPRLPAPVKQGLGSTASWTPEMRSSDSSTRDRVVKEPSGMRNQGVQVSSKTPEALRRPVAPAVGELSRAQRLRMVASANRCGISDSSTKLQSKKSPNNVQRQMEDRKVAALGANRRNIHSPVIQRPQRPRPKTPVSAPQSRTYRRRAAGASTVRRILSFTPDRRSAPATSGRKVVSSDAINRESCLEERSEAEDTASGNEVASITSEDFGRRRARVTVPRPFSLTGAALQRRTQMAIEEARRRTEEVEKRKRVFRARPMPDFSKPYPPPKSSL